jgi:retron-type reverse transcriptase
LAKTFKRLYPKIYDFENLYNAYLKARRGKRDKPSVLRFADNLEAELIQLQNELIWHEYSLGEYHCFKDPGPPVRNIAALPFRDRVVQHAIVSVIEPIWESRFVFDSYACRKGKGSVAAVRRAQYFMRTCRRSGGRVYALQSDIQSYFDSIPHAVVKRLLGKRIACRETLDVIFMIVDSATSLFGARLESSRAR